MSLLLIILEKPIHVFWWNSICAGPESLLCTIGFRPSEGTDIYIVELPFVRDDEGSREGLNMVPHQHVPHLALLSTILHTHHSFHVSDHCDLLWRKTETLSKHEPAGVITQRLISLFGLPW